MEKIDTLDKNILEIISNNARIPFKDVAARCGVSRAAIHQRVQRLIEIGVIVGSGYHVNPVSLGYNTCTYVGIIKLYARDNAHLMELLNDKLQEINGVVSTETLISLSQNIKKELPIGDIQNEQKPEMEEDWQKIKD